ncbi:MAG: hypothetical protein A4E48_01922 [Methanosaeta sp. PtaU1.Bin060]|nr:MAG: hypothetical protein A4E48_01922 [Methanosaeta sp. PtaU1.Bin060]
MGSDVGRKSPAKPSAWEKLEAEAVSALGERGHAQKLKAEVERLLAMAEAEAADSETVDRLDILLIRLTEAAKENVCKNTRCPHYDKKCKMR